METKHTPGPWDCYINAPCSPEHAEWRLITSANRMRVIANVHAPDGNSQAEADARLIAAAPELLEAAISNAEYRAARDSEFGRGYNAAKNGQRRDIQRESDDWYAGYDARAAIAKATGK